VEVVEFSDWTAPNLALASRDLDANYFQHQAFLDNAVRESGYPLRAVGIGILSNVGLYSTRIRSFAELKEGARVAVANDPVNQGRGLQLLEKAGLIRLREGVGPRARLSDIVDNPKHLKLVEIDGPQLVRAIDDVDLAQGYPGHFAAAGTLDPGSALLFSGVDDLYYASASSPAPTTPTTSASSASSACTSNPRRYASRSESPTPTTNASTACPGCITAPKRPSRGSPDRPACGESCPVCGAAGCWVIAASLIASSSIATSRLHLC